MQPRSDSSTLHAVMNRRPTPEPIRNGEESVWDYPRPPLVMPTDEVIEVRVGEVIVARSEPGRALRVTETASPPVYYVPQADVVAGALIPSFGRSVCEFKGEARYYAVRVADTEIEQAAWSYPQPWEGFEALVDHVAFFPGRVDCYVNGERVTPQEGGFYGGWITSRIAGPCKGAPGTGHW